MYTVSASEMTYIVSDGAVGALNSTNSTQLCRPVNDGVTHKKLESEKK